MSDDFDTSVDTGSDFGGDIDTSDSFDDSSFDDAFFDDSADSFDEDISEDSFDDSDYEDTFDETDYDSDFEEDISEDDLIDAEDDEFEESMDMGEDDFEEDSLTENSEDMLENDESQEFQEDIVEEENVLEEDFEEIPEDIPENEEILDDVSDDETPEMDEDVENVEYEDIPEDIEEDTLDDSNDGIQDENVREDTSEFDDNDMILENDEETDDSTEEYIDDSNVEQDEEVGDSAELVDDIEDNDVSDLDQSMNENDYVSDTDAVDEEKPNELEEVSSEDVASDTVDEENADDNSNENPENDNSDTELDVKGEEKIEVSDDGSIEEKDISDEGNDDSVTEDVDDGMNDENVDENTDSITESEETPNTEQVDELPLENNAKNIDDYVNQERESVPNSDVVEEKTPMAKLTDYMNSHEYGPGDFDTYSQDPEWRELQRQAFPDYELPPIPQDSAFNQLGDYMSDHNYGPDDFDTYSHDPKWRELQSYAFPDYELPPMQDTSKEAFAGLANYMSDHNYGPDDFDTYSQDPEWRNLQSQAFPDYELPPVIQQSDEDIPLSDTEEISKKTSDELLEIMPDTSEFNNDPKGDIQRSIEYNEQNFGKDSEQYQAMANRSLDPLRDEIKAKRDEYVQYQQNVGNDLLERRNSIDPSNPEQVNAFNYLVDDYNSNCSKYQNEISQSESNLQSKINELGIRGENTKTSFVGFNGNNNFEKAYDGFITSEQGGGTCGINFSASVLNQQSGSRMTQKEGVCEYLSYGLCDDGSSTCDIDDVGGTNYLQREEFFEKHNMQCETISSDNLNLEEMASRFEKGESIGLSVHAQDLDSHEMIDEISRTSFFDTEGNYVDGDDRSNHMTTIAGFDRNFDGTIKNIYINDTGGWNRTSDGKNINRIAISADKFYAMCNNTRGMRAQFVKTKGGF